MITVRLPDELRDRIDAVRGDVPRERWVRRALEAALGSQQGGKAREAEEPGVVKRGTSASPRASKPEPDDAPAGVPLPKIAKRKW